MRKGFYENSIEGISKRSKIKKPATVVRILKNTAKCLEAVTVALDDYRQISKQWILNLHQTLLCNDNIEETIVSEEGESDYSMYSLITTGKFRHRAISIIQGTSVIQFYHASRIEELMDWYVEMTQLLLADSNVNSFLQCAWLQWAFLRIHSFDDGNGHLARITSSIPLAKCQLPPVVVYQVRKIQLFHALRGADENSDLVPLAALLENALSDGMKAIETLPTEEMLGASFAPMRITFGGRCHHISSRRRSSENSCSSTSEKA